MWIPGLGPLSKAQVASLKLDAKQQALFDKARDASQQAMEARRQAGPAPHELLQAQLNAGKLDPYALAAEGDKRRAQFESQETALRTQWLAVWDSLNDAQRAQVTQIVKERVAKMKEHHGKRGEHRSGRRGKPPAPLPPPSNPIPRNDQPGRWPGFFMARHSGAHSRKFHQYNAAAASPIRCRTAWVRGPGRI
ncbi:heavy-metal resistance family protein [Bordetella holmesii 35009]|nr:heavy-metal resistance family protein [Bordetella holmesii 35009]